MRVRERISEWNSTTVFSSTKQLQTNTSRTSGSREDQVNVSFWYSNWIFDMITFYPSTSLSTSRETEMLLLRLLIIHSGSHFHPITHFCNEVGTCKIVISTLFRQKDIIRYPTGIWTLRFTHKSTIHQYCHQNSVPKLSYRNCWASDTNLLSNRKHW